MAQPAISRQVHILEEELGVSLFHRDGHGAVPTNAARTLSRAAENIFRELEKATAEISDMKESPTGSVNLGVPPSLSQYFATHLADAVKSHYPNICLHISEAWTGFLYDWIVSGRIDLGIIYSSQITDFLDWEPLLTEDVCVIVPEMAASDRKEYPLAQVARLPLVVPPRPHGLRLVVDKAFAKRGLTPNIVLEPEVWSVLKDSVERGQVYGLLPPSEVREEIDAGRFHAVPITEPGIKRTLCIARHRQRRKTRAVETLFELIIDDTEQRVREHVWEH